MLIAEVLAKKGDNVTTIDGNETVATAIALLAKNKIGALVVLDTEFATVGIFTERDVVRVIDAQGPDALGKPVSNAMTNNPLTCLKTDSVNTVLKIMSERHFRHMPVFENGQLCGMISIRDLVEERLEKAEGEAEAIRAYVAGA